MTESTTHDEYEEWTDDGQKDEPTVTDEIVEEAMAERPAGLPSLMPFAVLNANRRKRAEFFAAAMSPAVQELMEAGDTDSLGNVAIAFRALADMEDALRKVVPPGV